MAHALNDHYGGNDLRIYAHLEDVLCVRLGAAAVREDLYKSFLALCDRLGLPSRGWTGWWTFIFCMRGCRGHMCSS